MQNPEVASYAVSCDLALTQRQNLLDNSKPPQDNEMKFYHFNFMPLRHILYTLTMLIVLRCCHGNLLFPMCHIIFWDGKKKKLE